MKIGVLGGTFNPIHNAHVQMAVIARDALGLDRVLMMVAADPPHKTVDGHVSAARRYHMTQLAVEDVSRVEACDMEMRRAGKSYTADTLLKLHEADPDAKLYLIVGSDMLNDLPTWYEPERIASLATIAAVARRGQDAGDGETAERLRKTLGFDVRLLTGEADRLSSTQVRDRLEEGLPVEGMLPAAVERYCYETGLYFPQKVQRMQRALGAALDEKRFRHTMGVARTAAALAARWGENAEAARVAALLHDCAKRMDPTTLAVWSGDDTGVASVYHAFAGAVLARMRYGVTDDAILRAIRLHSTGDAGMTTLDQIVYLSDLIEPNRSFPAVDAMRENVALGADEAMLRALLMTKDHVASLCRTGTETAFHPAGERAIRYFEDRIRAKGTEEQV